MKNLSAALGVFLKIIAMPLVFINTFGWIIAGIWLLFDGNWRITLLGILYIAVAASIWGLILLPSTGLGLLAIKMIKTSRLGYVFFVIVWVYDAVVILFSCSLVFSVILNLNKGSIIPAVFYAFMVALGPWSYMASKETNLDGYNATYMTVLLTYIGLIGTVILLLFGRTLSASFEPLRIALLVMILVQSTFGYHTVHSLVLEDDSGEDTTETPITKRLEEINGSTMIVEDELQTWDDIK